MYLSVSVKQLGSHRSDFREILLFYYFFENTPRNFKFD
jgi:hypothetical protein